MIADVYTLLSRDHERIANLCRAIRECDDAKQRARKFERLVVELSLHAHLEDHVLYQPLRKAFPREVAHGDDEHQKIHDAITACRAAADEEAFVELFDELRARVEQHMLDEETTFFHQARRLIPDGRSEGSEYRRVRRQLETGRAATF